MIYLSDVPKSISSLTRMDEIDSLINEFKNRTGKKVGNISSWSFSDEYFSSVLSNIRWPRSTEDLSYNYSWELGIPEKINSHLNIPDDMTSIVVTNSSQAITLISRLTCNFSKNHTLLAPFYWSIAENIKSIRGNIKTVNLKVNRTGEYIFDEQCNNNEIVWFTLPPFSTGGKIAQSTIEKIDALSSRGTYFIFDEALRDPFKTIVLKLNNRKNIFSILSPHKHLNVNGNKFSIIIFPTRFGNYFIENSDSMLGSLPSSTVTAAFHFLSDNYEHVRQRLKLWLNHANNDLSALDAMYPSIIFDLWDDGIYRSVYIPKIDWNYLDNKDNFFELLEKTNCAVIPGTRNNSSSSRGLSFRVNLTQNSAKYIHELKTTFTYLSSISH